jgi:hypothetical protein
MATFARLRQAFFRIADMHFVNALFDDLVADVVSAVHIKLALFAAERNRKRNGMRQDQLCGLQGSGRRFSRACVSLAALVKKSVATASGCAHKYR